MSQSLSLEVVQVPVSDVDRALAFYSGQLGFALDHDTGPGESFRGAAEYGEGRDRTGDTTIFSTAPYGEGGRDWSFWAKELLQTGRKYLRDDLPSVAGFFALVDLW